MDDDPDRRGGTGHLPGFHTETRSLPGSSNSSGRARLLGEAALETGAGAAGYASRSRAGPSGGQAAPRPQGRQKASDPANCRARGTRPAPSQPPPRAAALTPRRPGGRARPGPPRPGPGRRIINQHACLGLTFEYLERLLTCLWILSLYYDFLFTCYSLSIPSQSPLKPSISLFYYCQKVVAETSLVMP